MTARKQCGGPELKKFKATSEAKRNVRVDSGEKLDVDEEEIFFIESTSVLRNHKNLPEIPSLKRALPPDLPIRPKNRKFGSNVKQSGSKQKGKKLSNPEPMVAVQTTLNYDYFFKPRKVTPSGQQSDGSSKPSSERPFGATSVASFLLTEGVEKSKTKQYTQEIVAAKDDLIEELVSDDERTSLRNEFRTEPFFSEGLDDGDGSGDEFLMQISEDLAAMENSASESKRILKFYNKRVQAPTASSNSSRKCPFYKLLPGTDFSVDAFNFGVIPNIASYFLSHFHSDHYIGMTKSFSQPLYCSEITARLVSHRIRVDPQHINALPMNTAVFVNDIEVTLLDANHCPGSVLFLFKLRDGRVYLHTGDFRADPQVLGADPHLRNLREISKVWLDTTYLDPYYEFESQDVTVAFAGELALEYASRNPNVLVICGTYSVGKEKIFMRVAEVLKAKVAVTSYKRELLRCFQWAHLENMLTNDWSMAQVHVLPMRNLNIPELQEHLMKYPKFSEILAFQPTGWEFNKKLFSLRDIKPRKSGSVSIYGLPYSEHSSYRELEWFVKTFKPKDIIPTVNVGSAKKRQEMNSYLKNWMNPSSKPVPSMKQNTITSFLQR